MPNDQQHLTKQEYALELAYRLRSLRESSGLTQEQVAERAGMSSKTYQKYEQGVSKKGIPTNPRLDSLVSLADVFEIDAGDLIRVDYDALDPLDPEQGKA